MKKFLLIIFGLLFTICFCTKTFASEYVTEVHAQHILVSNRSQAEQIRTDIISNKGTFEQYARMYSKCPSGQNGGDLGYFRRGQMVPQFEVAAFNMPIGEISKPVWTQFGWHLIKVVDKR